MNWYGISLLLRCLDDRLEHLRVRDDASVSYRHNWALLERSWDHVGCHPRHVNCECSLESEAIVRVHLIRCGLGTPETDLLLHGADGDDVVAANSSAT